MNFLNHFKHQIVSRLIRKQFDTSVLGAHENWYAFEKSGPLEAMINSDDTSIIFSKQRITHDGLIIKNKGHSTTVDNYLKLLKFHHLNISKAIEATKAKLSNFEPIRNDSEAQELEWFKVSMKVASESIKNFNPLTSDLQYKFFCGTLPDSELFILRIIYYNLDIVFEIDDKLTYRIRDTKGSQDKSKHVIKEAKIESLYNDFINTLITFLVELKNTETKILPIECES